MRTRILAGLAVLATAPALAQAPLPLKIAVMEDFSGVYADNQAGEVEAITMAIEDFGGKVLGRPIELLVADHQNKPDIAATVSRKWYDVDDVKAILGIGNSAAALAVQKLGEEKQKITIVTSAASADLTGKSCSPFGVHFVYDTYALANVTGKAAVKAGGDSWFFLTADYAFGHALERDTMAVVKANGGKVVGAVRHPLNSTDLSSFLLQAQGSKAKVIGLANAGGDTINAIKQAAEFGIVKSGQSLAGLLVMINNIHSLTPAVAQGLLLTEAFYWDMNDETRAWTKRLRQKRDVMPNQLTAGAYGATLHYLKAVKEAGTDEPKAVMAKMKALPVNDFFTKNGRVREDGRTIRDMYLFKVKSPAESKGWGDYYQLVGTVPGDEAYRPLKEGGCPFVKVD